MADPPRVVIGDASPSANQGEVLKEIERSPSRTAGPTSSPASPRSTACSRSRPIPRKEVVFLTDLQAASWRKPGRRGGPEAGRRQAGSPQGAVDRHRPGQGRRREPGGDRPPARIAGRHARPTDARGDRHGPGTSARGRQRRQGPAPDRRPARPGAAGPRDRRRRRRRVRLPAHLREPGDHVLEVRIDDDPLPLDNRRRLAVPVKECLARPARRRPLKPEAFESETDYLAQALNPEVDLGRASPSQIRAEVVTESQLGTQGPRRRTTRWCSATSASSARPRSPRSTPT